MTCSPASSDLISSSSNSVSSLFQNEEHDGASSIGKLMVKSCLQSGLQNKQNPEIRICTELREILQCPVCLLPVCIPIYQCQNGHLFCDRCFPRLRKRCPLCRTTIDPPSRNRALEALLTLFSFPCRYNCNTMIPLSEMRAHERNCEYRPLKCPFPGCYWTGRDVLDHILSEHPRILNLDGEQIVFLATEINIPGKRVNWVMIQRCFNHYFLLWLERCRQPVEASCEDRASRTFTVDHYYWATVQLISTNKSESEQFRYRFELEKPGTRFKKLSWESEIKCIGKSRQEILQSDDCLIISGQLANYFMQNRRLPLNVTILKNKEL